MNNIDRFDAALREYHFSIVRFRRDFSAEQLAAIRRIDDHARQLVVYVLQFLDFADETHVPTLKRWRENFGAGSAFEIPWPLWINDYESDVTQQEGEYAETSIRLSEQLAWRLVQATVVLDYVEEFLMTLDKRAARRAETVEAAVVDGNTVRKPSGKSLSSSRRGTPDPFLLVDQFHECKKRNRSDWVAYITCHAVLGCELLSRLASALSKLTTFVKIISK